MKGVLLFLMLYLYFVLCITPVMGLFMFIWLVMGWQGEGITILVFAPIIIGGYVGVKLSGTKIAKRILKHKLFQ